MHHTKKSMSQFSKTFCLKFDFELMTACFSYEINKTFDPKSTGIPLIFQRGGTSAIPYNNDGAQKITDV